jgi:hypothetical protein
VMPTSPLWKQWSLSLAQIQQHTRPTPWSDQIQQLTRPISRRTGSTSKVEVIVEKGVYPSAGFIKQAVLLLYIWDQEETSKRKVAPPQEWRTK